MSRLRLILCLVFIALPVQGMAAGIRVPLDAETFRAVQIDGVRAILKIHSSDIVPPELIITGPREKAEEITVDQFGRVLSIRQPDQEGDLSNYRGLDENAVVTIRLVVPTQTELALINFSGRAAIGDVNGRFSIRGGRSEVDVGNVQELYVDRWGSGYIHVGNIALMSEIVTKGSARIEVGDVPDIRIVHVGSGEVHVGSVTSHLAYDGAGSGNLVVEASDAAINIETNGSGNVHIKSGKADPFFVTLNGGGAVIMDGTAVNPVLRHDNRGRIEIGTVEGLRQEGPAPAKFSLEWDETIGQE